MAETATGAEIKTHLVTYNLLIPEDRGLQCPIKDLARLMRASRLA